MSEDIRPDYYKHPSGVECCKITDHLNFNLGNALKYTWRWQSKNGLDDLLKARFYLGRFIDSMEGPFDYEEDEVFSPNNCEVRIKTVSNYLGKHGGNKPLLELVRDMLSEDRVTDWRERSLRAINEEISSIESRSNESQG